MNSSATILIRACRARPATSPQLLCAQTKTTSTAAATATASSALSTSSRTRSLAYRHGAPLARRTFSSHRLLKQPQPINDHHPSGSAAGLDATILGQSSNNDGSILSSRTPPTEDLGSSSSPRLSAATQAPPSSSYDAALLPSNLLDSDLAFLSTSPTHIATVTRTGTMQKTVRATRRVLTFHAAYQKYYTRSTHMLVHDEHNLLREGDVIRIGAFPPAWRQQRDAKGQVVVKRHRPRDRNGVVKELGVPYLVREIITPFGTPLHERTSGVVGGAPGRWKGTEGEVKKIAVRQKGRKDGSKKARKGVKKGARDQEESV
ncbi:hypothetical protein PV04_05212 [Phialophora macrospora]|uniref:Ribosomal protein S17 n=1 Tax=Phialophora macrospora TaxID=1851006 RepID=A0A0D2FS01_9EURO|nr:hypothetical protein PV04_05212 [Phialophora macrospora]